MKLRLQHCVSGIRQTGRAAHQPHRTQHDSSGFSPSDTVKTFTYSQIHNVHIHTGFQNITHRPFSMIIKNSKLTTNHGDVAPMLQKQKSQTYIHGSGFVLTRDMNKM